MNNFLCPFPWLTPCVTTDGHFRICPVSQSSQSKGMVKNKSGEKPHIDKIQKISDVIDADSLKDLRKRMILGQDLSDTCYRCISEEAHGLQSRRQMELVRLPEFTEELVSQVTKSDGALSADAPIYSLVIRMGNKCNLVCRMCGPSSSSAWYKEWAETRHPGFQEEGGRLALVENQRGQVVVNPNPYTWSENESSLRLVKMCESSLRKLHFSGGEPLLSKGHIEILRHLVESQSAPRIGLEYNSNLTVLSDEMLELWSHFESVEVGISIDGPPEVNEYIRYPVKSSQLNANLQKLDRSKVRGRFWLATTVQIYNLPYLLDLERWLTEQNYKKIESVISWHVLRSPSEQSIFSLPIEAKKEMAQQLSSSKLFGAIATLIFEEDSSEKFEKFIQSTQAMDTYRGQSIRDLPKLWSLIESSYR